MKLSAFGSSEYVCTVVIITVVTVVGIEHGWRAEIIGYYSRKGVLIVLLLVLVMIFVMMVIVWLYFDVADANDN